MKAVLRVSKSSAYAALNGKVFTIVGGRMKGKNEKVYALQGVNEQFPNSAVDFFESEIIIVGKV